jgi:hypothetical protein
MLVGHTNVVANFLVIRFSQDLVEKVPHRKRNEFLLFDRFLSFFLA